MMQPDDRVLHDLISQVPSKYCTIVGAFLCILSTPEDERSTNEQFLVDLVDKVIRDAYTQKGLEQ